MIAEVRQPLDTDRVAIWRGPALVAIEEDDLRIVDLYRVPLLREPTPEERARLTAPPAHGTR